MTFKEQIAEDIENIFFNIDEFGTIHKINEIEYTIVVDNQALLERQLKDEIENIFLGDILFFIRKSDLDYIPIIDDRINFDGLNYQVSKVTQNFGILEIILKGNFGV